MATYTIPNKTYVDTQDALKVNNADMVMAIGNINSPLLDMPLKNSLAMKAGVGSATFTRASTATYIDRYGVLKTAAIDEPRFEKEGYLNEGSSTNSATYSGDFTNASWAKTVTLGGVTSYAGIGLTLLTDNSTTVSQFAYKDIAIANDSNTHSVSIFLKQSGTDNKVRFVVQLQGGTTPSSATFDFDFTTGTAILVTLVGTASLLGVYKLSEGVYRLKVNITNNSTGNTNLRSVIYPSVRTGIEDMGSVYAGGLQVELNLPFATSYIPTTSAAVTRSADYLYASYNNNFGGCKNPLSVIIDFKGFTGTFSANRMLFSTTGSAAGYGIYINLSSTGGVQSAILNGTIGVAVPATSETLSKRVAFTSNGSVLKSYVNGVLNESNDTVGTLTEAVGNIRIGGRGSVLTENFYGHLYNLRIYDKELTAQEVALA